MGLSVYTYYETFKPHFSFRFKVDFLSNPSLYRLVQDIKLPSISINSSDGKKRFGQTQFVLPFFEFGDQELEITFVETDTMKVLDYLTNNYNWPNLPNTEDIIVTEYDDTLRNVIKRTKYTITLFSYNAPQWQNSGSPSNMTITATYIVRSSRDITKDEYDLYNLPIYSPVVDMVQDMNVIGSSVDEGSAESEWQKFLGSLKDEETELENKAKEMEDAKKEWTDAVNHPEQGKGGEKLGEKQTGTIPQQAGGALAQRLSGHALNEYNEYISKMKAKYKDFDENKDAFIFFDIASNTKYAVKNGQIVKEYNAYTAVNDPKKGAGEATEGVYVISEETGKGGKHKSRQNNAINGIKSFGLDVDVISQEVASGKYKNVREAIKGHGVSEEKIKAWENSHKDTTGSTMKASQGHWDYLNYSTYSNNQIDEGNGNTGRENQGAYGIHSHVNYKENDKKVLEYEKKKAAGTNTAQDDLEIRKYLSKSKATEGCSIMTSQDIAWESEFIKDNGKIYQFNANGTSSYNKNNDKNIDIAQANNKNNKVNV